RNLRNWSRLRMMQPKLWRRIRVWQDELPFPEVGYGPWRGPLERTVDELHRQDPFDMVVATANPHVAFAAAYHLHKTNGVPYVMDYRDAWLLNVFSGERLHGPRSRAARWERRLVESAHEVWFVNDPIREWHAALYPHHAHRMHTVANGFDPDLAPAIHGRSAAGNRPIRFGYIGTVSPKVPLAEFIDGWRLGREMSPSLAIADAAIRGYLGFYAMPDPKLFALLDSARDVSVHYDGPAAKGEIGSVYDTFDALLLILGTGRYVTSGKVFEYLATGLPIVSVHDPGNAASDVLRGHPLWFPAASLEPSDVANALTDAAEAAQTVGDDVRAKAREFGARFQRGLQLDPRIDALHSTVSETRRSMHG
ncbi:MAG: glycosyltransferase, partial [Jiangellaceae bacterium]